MATNPIARAQRRLERHEELVARAFRVISDGGVDALSMNGLARDAGITPPAVYRYFESKGALLAELAVRVLHELSAELEGKLTLDPEEKPIEFIEAIVREYLRYARTNRGAFNFLSTLLCDPRVLVSEFKHSVDVVGALDEFLMPVYRAFDSGVRQGLLAKGNAKNRALILLGAVNGTFALQKQERHKIMTASAERLAVSAAEVLLRGWQTGP